MLGTSNLKGAGIFSGIDRHFNTMISFGILMVTVSCSTAVYAAGSEEEMHNDSAAAEQYELEQLASSRHTEDDDGGGGSDGNGGGEGGIGNANVGDGELHASAGTGKESSSASPGEMVLCAIQAMGWIGICSQSFFWTVRDLCDKCRYHAQCA